MRNRWVVLLAGILIQTILGGIYAWSVFVPSLVEGYGLTKGQCGSVFGLTIAVFTVSMIFGGRLLVSRGPRIPALIGAFLFMAGYIVAAASGGRYALLLLGISVLSGMGIGFGYVCPLTVGMQWFPKHRGLITGVSVAGFGGGAILLTSVATHFLDAGMDVLRFFAWIAAVAGGMLIVAALLLAVPEKTGEPARVNRITADLFSWPFALCLFGIFMGTFSGLLVIGNLAPIVSDAGFSATVAAGAVSIFAVGNAAGRILWGFLFDRIRYLAIPASLACFTVLLLLLAVSNSVWLVLLCTVLLGFGFGANFVIYASALSSHFHIDSFPRLYPICFLGYGLAGVTGPGIGGYLADATGSYASALGVSTAMVAVAAVVTALGMRVFEKGGVADESPIFEPVEETGRR